MLADIPGWMIVVGEVIGAVAGLIALISIGALGYFTVRRARIVSEDQLAQSAVASLTGELAAYKAQVERQQTEIDSLTALNASQRETISGLEAKSDAQDKRIDDLTALITGTERIDELRMLCRNGFRALNVPEHLLDTA